MLDERPIPAQLEPFQTAVVEGKRYVWCACGRSANQPFCDGSHAGTGIQPVVYLADKSGDVWFCGCKATGSKPMCDGSHKTVGDKARNG